VRSSDQLGKELAMAYANALSRGLASAVISAAAGLVTFGALLPSAQAGPRPSAGIARPGLHTAGKVALGSSRGLFKDVFTEAPNGAVYYSRGSVVRVVNGNSAPAIAVRAGKRVFALAATSSDLFVQTGLTVTEYSRPGGRILRHWKLTSPVTPITFAGLLVAGRTLWSWTDWGTDQSGFEFATLSRIRTSSPAVHKMSLQVYPADMDADSSGLYFQAQSKNGLHSFLAHATPSGSVRLRRDRNINAPLAILGGKVVVLSFHSDGHAYADSYRKSDLLRTSSRRVSVSDRAIAGTTAGLLVLRQPCAQLTCAAATVGKLDPAAGTVTGAVTVPHAFLLLPGPAGAVVTVTGGHMFLIRIGS
jgi:hypothetical protein